MKRITLIAALMLTAMPQWHCATTITARQSAVSVQDSTTTVANISEAEIRREMRATNRTLYAMGFGLGCGTLGFLAGAKIGYEIDYPHDLKNGCEDCGLDGLIIGSLIGASSGLIGGMNWGRHIGAKQDREAAIQRIQLRRKLQEQ